MSKGKGIGFFFGMIGGAIAGVLLAPKSGKETQADIKREAGELKAKAEQALEDFAEKGKQSVDKGKKVAAAAKTEVKKSSQKVAAGAKKTVATAKAEGAKTARQGAKSAKKVAESVKQTAKLTGNETKSAIAKAREELERLNSEPK